MSQPTAGSPANKSAEKATTQGAAPAKTPETSTDTSAGEEVTGKVVVLTKARHLTTQYDEDAEKEFRSRYEGKDLSNVEQTGKVQYVGERIEYDFKATVK